MLGGGFADKAKLRIGSRMPSLGLMFFQGQISDQHVSILVDIGVSHLLMSSQMVKSMGLFPMEVDSPI